LRPMGAPRERRTAVSDKDGRAFGLLDFRTSEHVELLLDGRHPLRVSRAHFVGRAQGAELRLTQGADEVFLGKLVTTIDGIDLGTVVEVVRGKDGAVEAFIASTGGEEEALAVPPQFAREVSSHIILEPSVEEVQAAQEAARASPRVHAAIARASRQR
jgi:PRC-barrel domain protein